MIERAGVWRRGAAALVDLILAQVLLQSIVAVLFSVTGGHVATAVTFYSSCQPVGAVPTGVTLPAGFVITSQSLCTSRFFVPTQSLYVARHEETSGGVKTTTTVSAATSPDGSGAMRVLGLDALFYPLFLLLRWASDRFAGGSLGRRLVRIAVTDVGGTATGAVLARLLARRYSRLAWIYAPGALIMMLGAVFEAAFGAASPVLTGLSWVGQNALMGAAHLAAAMAIFRHQDTFYDAPCGTAVAPRSEIARARDMWPDAVVPDGPGPFLDLAGALWLARQSLPWLTFGLAGLMVVVFVGEVLFPWAPATPAGLSSETLTAWGGMDRELAIMVGQPYRLLTAMFLHGSLIHLVVNIAALLVVGFLLERGIGPVLFGAIFLLGGLAGSLASILVNPPEMISVGASGAILALFAAALPLSFVAPAGNQRRWLWAWPITVCIPAIVPVVTLPGMFVVDRADHAGGEILGLLLGILIAMAWRRGVVGRPSRRVGLSALVVLASFVGATVAVGGLRAPVQAVRLVPSAELPATDEAWIRQAPVLAADYPEDPRALLFLAQADVLGHRAADGFRDLDRALAAQRHLAPSVAEAYGYAAHIVMSSRFEDVGDLESAIQEDSSALALRQDDVVAFRQRGIAEYYRGRANLALEDLDRAVTLRPVDAYAALWDDIVAVRSGQTDRRAVLELAIQAQRWPSPVLDFYSDHIGSEALSLAAADPKTGAVRDQHCEADFYRAERFLMENDVAAARPLFVAAADECPHSFIEYGAAQQELAGHGGLPPG